jgi:UDP-N-acetylmuramate--alanine ligase
MALMEEFAASFGDADCVILHDIYASAREAKMEGVSGIDLFEKVKRLRPDLVDLSDLFKAGKVEAGSFGNPRFDGQRGFILYTSRPQDAADFIQPFLRPGDLFVTMGAGDNWKLGVELLSRLGAKEGYNA